MSEYINNIRALPLPAYAGDPEPLPAEQPAQPFPGEPGDDPGTQPGDPGAEPPPASLERVPDVESVVNDITARFRSSRFEIAFAAMMQGLASSTDRATLALRELRGEDLVFLRPVLADYVRSTHDFTRLLSSLMEPQAATVN